MLLSPSRDDGTIGPRCIAAVRPAGIVQEPDASTTGRRIYLIQRETTQFRRAGTESDGVLTGEGPPALMIFPAHTINDGLTVGS